MASLVSPARRHVLLGSLFCSVGVLCACGGGSDDSAQAASPAPPPGGTPAPSPAPAPSLAPAPSPAWNLGPLYFAVESRATLNLEATLPNGVARGGTFGISNAGTSLPVGMSLSSSGILSIGAAAVGSVTGVVFTYSEP